MSETENVEAQAEATPTAGGKRAPLVLGEVSIVVDEDQTSAGRGSRMDTDPVALAVKDATQGVWGRVYVEGADKVTGAKSILRRAGQYYKIGVNIDPRDDLVDNEGRNYVRFKTGERRKITKKSTGEGQPEANVAGVPEGSVAGDAPNGEYEYAQ